MLEFLPVSSTIPDMQYAFVCLLVERNDYNKLGVF